ncbi:MAG: hypothetical protein B7Y02_16720 [Rhodobacterales bacterium 17-64-5]|nr:MAG: hypothetical protein B7Y02_16720 [Rhodobacterales bacterium 17-64-5]
MSMAIAFKVRIIGGALGLITAFTSTVWAETSAPADIIQEDAYLDVLPKVEIPDDVQPIPGAVNEEFRYCRALWPAEYELSQKGPEARAYRDIYGFIKVRNVVQTQNCSCAGKVASWEAVEALAAVLRKTEAVDRLTWQQTLEVFETSNALFPIAETMCGGSF